MGMTIEQRRKLEAKKFTDSIESLFEKEFERYKKLSYNPNTKGYDYEATICNILQEFLGSRFDFYLRSHIIDRELKYLEIFPKKGGGNEIDVVATFKGTVPKIILKTQKTNFVFYDAVAFLVEIKSTLNKQSLKKDLEKLEMIDKLPIDKNRFPVPVFGESESVVKHRPLRILVYEKKSIITTELEMILKNNNFWDLILVVEDKFTLVNKLNIPYAKFQEKILNKFSDNNMIYWVDFPFIAFLDLLISSLPDPQTVNIIKNFIKLAAIAWRKS